MYAPGKCVRAKGCAGCLKKCVRDGVSVEEDGIRLDWGKCRTCMDFACAEACPTEALRKCGEWYRVEEVMQRLERERECGSPPSDDGTVRPQPDGGACSVLRARPCADGPGKGSGFPGRL